MQIRSRYKRYCNHVTDVRLNLRDSIFVSPCTNIPAGKAKRKESPILARLRERKCMRTAKLGPDVSLRLTTLSFVGRRVYGKVRASPLIHFFFLNRELSFFLFVNYPPIISNDCPAKRSQQSLHRKLVPIPLIVSGVGNLSSWLD